MSSDREIREVYWSEVNRAHSHRRTELAIETAAKMQKSTYDRVAEVMDIARYRQKFRPRGVKRIA